MKFYEATTTQTQEKFTSNDMEFPQLMICSSIGYKTDALNDMGLSKNVLSTMEPRLEILNNYDFDVQTAWDKGTYSINDFAIKWMVTKGKLHSFFHTETNNYV